MTLAMGNIADGPIGQLVDEFRGSLKDKREESKKMSLLDGWKVTDIGYFSPDLPDKYGLGDYVTLGKDTHWRSVNLFIDAVRMPLFCCLEDGGRKEERASRRRPQTIEQIRIT